MNTTMIPTQLTQLSLAEREAFIRQDRRIAIGAALEKARLAERLCRALNALQDIEEQVGSAYNYDAVSAAKATAAQAAWDFDRGTVSVPRGE